MGSSLFITKSLLSHIVCIYFGFAPTQLYMYIEFSYKQWSFIGSIWITPKTFKHALRSCGLLLNFRRIFIVPIWLTKENYQVHSSIRKFFISTANWNIFVPNQRPERKHLNSTPQKVESQGRGQERRIQAPQSVTHKG